MFEDILDKKWPDTVDDEQPGDMVEEVECCDGTGPDCCEAKEEECDNEQCSGCSGNCGHPF